MRGFVFMLEAVFAGLLLVGFMISIADRYARHDESPDLAGILPGLDSQGLLRPYAVSGDKESLEALIEIPGYVDSVGICSQAEPCPGVSPDSRSVYASSYFISGLDTIEPREVRLYAQAV